MNSKFRFTVNAMLISMYMISSQSCDFIRSHRESNKRQRLLEAQIDSLKASYELIQADFNSAEQLLDSIRKDSITIILDKNID